MILITIVTGACKPTNTGGPHIVGSKCWKFLFDLRRRLSPMMAVAPRPLRQLGGSRHLQRAELCRRSFKELNRTVLYYTYIHYIYNIYVIICIYIYVLICIYIYICTYVRTHVRMYAQTSMRACIHTYISTYVHTYTRTYVHTYVRSYMHTFAFHDNFTVWLLCGPMN